MNEALNGIGLAKNIHIEGIVHSVYNDKVRLRLNNISSNLTPAQTKAALTDLIADIRAWIQTHPAQNLNNIVL